MLFVYLFILLFFYSLFAGILVDKQSLLCNPIQGQYCDSFTSGISVEFEFLLLFSAFFEARLLSLL